MRVMVMGSTGAIGSEIIRQCLDDARITDVLAISRRALRIHHPKLRVAALTDFKDYSAILDDLSRVEFCFCALGVSQTQERDPTRYYEITHNYVMAAAEALNGRNPRARFFFVSGYGTDPTQKSKLYWARVKGETENDLRKLFGERLTIFRPGYVHPVHPREHFLLLDFLSRPLILFKPLLPWLVTDTVEVARAMIKIVAGDKSPALVENRDIRAAATENPKGR